MLGSLEGVRVLDLSRVLAGPYCTMMLGDMGADVIKVEEPDRGDELRSLVARGRGGHQDFFYVVNRNKRSIAVDLKSEQGRGIVYDLAASSHVAVENFSPGVAGRLGVGYHQLREFNPSIVYCSISGFGQNGPWRDRRAYDFIIQALCGIMAATGFPDGPPVRPGFMIADVGSGLVAAFAILTALYHQQRTGEGQYIDVALMDTITSLWGTSAADFLANGEVPPRLGNQVHQRVPSSCYQAGDGRYLVIAANTPPHWTKLCELLGSPEMASDPRYDTMAKRIQRREEVNAFIEEKLKQRASAEWERLLTEGGIACGRVNTLEELASEPQMAAREMFPTVDHPVSGKVRQIGMPYKLSETPGSIRRPPPLLGQHTEEVLARVLGYSTERTAALKRDGVIGARNSR